MSRSTHFFKKTKSCTHLPRLALCLKYRSKHNLVCSCAGSIHCLFNTVARHAHTIKPLYHISLFFTLALMLVLLYFMIYRPQKKQEKKDAAMRAALEIGDQVTTIGGVIGRVVAIKDDTFVLETGSDRVKIRFTKSAISSVEKLNMDNAPAKK